MMFVYYGYLLPLSTRIGRGLYQDGVWTDSGFMRYTDIGGLAWKGDRDAGAGLAQKTIARRLRVPGVLSAKSGTCCGTRSASTTIEFDAGPGSSSRQARHAGVSLT